MSRNPFYTESDDDRGFGSGSGASQGGPRAVGGGYGNYEEGGNLDDDFMKPVTTQQLADESYQRQTGMTRNALASIYDSERMGIATAEELIHQGEQLDNIERKTDTINQDLKASQKSLTGIKSIFGGIKNWWNKDKNQSDARPEPVTRESKLRDTVEAHSELTPHPGMRDVSGFYEDDVDTASGGTRYDTSAGQSRGYSGTSSTAQKQGQTSRFEEYDNQLNKDLDLMSDGMSRLKGLARGLGDEIESQNEQIDQRINPKVERAEAKIRDQNRQMRGILGK